MLPFNITNGAYMNINDLEKNWNAVKGQVKVKFSKLNAEEISSINGKKEAFISKLMERYTYSRDQAERELATFVSSCECDQPKVAKAV
jgi:uncharacterized protein YjbJ (UPF0337 family)